MEPKINYPTIGGQYYHYKGGLYEVITLAVHTETKEVLVIYKSILFGTISARPLDSFNELISEENNIKTYRFIRVS